MSAAFFSSCHILSGSVVQHVVRGHPSGLVWERMKQLAANAQQLPVTAGELRDVLWTQMNFTQLLHKLEITMTST